MSGPERIDKTQAAPVRRKAFHSVGRKFSISLIGITTLILIIFAVVAILINRERSEAQLHRTMSNYLSVTEVALRVPVWNVDTFAVQGVTDALLLDGDVHYAEVIDGDSQIAVSVREDLEGLLFDSFADTEDYMTGAAAVRHQGEEIAVLRLAVSRAAIADAVQINALAILGLTLLIVGAIAVTSVYATRRYIAGPMARLQESASAIASGDLDREVPAGRNDEIGRLATDFDTMRQAVKSLFGDLNTANETLERRVVERTQEITHKNRELETLSGKLAKYLSPQVYASIFSGRQEVKLQSQRKKLTVFFSDIAGFTDTTDRLESEELTMLLNRYLSAMSEVALAHGATIDKYMGDGIMIFFGDPESRGVQEDALACVRMAVDMQSRMAELADELRTLGVSQPQRARMGINTGFCTVGNFGSNDRMDYTIIGGAVNIASRLEQEAEAGGILISYETYAHVKDHFRTEPVGELQVKGLAHPILTYRVLGTVEEGTRILDDLFALRMDLAGMTTDQRAEAEEELRQALTRLDEVKRD